MKYVQKLKDTNALVLFPSWKPSHGEASAEAEKWFIKLLRKTNLRDESRGAKLAGMHAFRHTVSHLAKNAFFDESEIVGHAIPKADRVAECYRGKLTLANKKIIVEKITYNVNFVVPVV